MSYFIYPVFLIVVCYTVNKENNILTAKRKTNDQAHGDISRVPMDRKRIVEAAALELLNKEGLDQLSMRRLADLLGIHAASLHW